MLSLHAQKIQDLLMSFGLDSKVKEFAHPTHTAKEAAEALGCEAGQIVKSLIFKGRLSGQPILLLVSGANRVDEDKAGKLIGEEIEKADAEFVREKTGFAIGGVAPVGHKEKMKTFIDEDLMVYPNVWAAAGHPHSIFDISPRDLLKITGGIVISVKLA